jgi:hypothetical protein
MPEAADTGNHHPIAGAGGDDVTVNQERLEKLFLSLA